MRQVLFLSLLMSFSTSIALAAKVNIATTGLDAIYGRDDREYITNKSDPRVKEISNAVAIIVTSDLLEKGMFKTTINAKSLQEEFNMCVSEHFITGPAPRSVCTGFLVAPDVLVSAGHCFVSEDDCAHKKIIFDVDSTKQSKKGYSVGNSSVYSCSKIISSMNMDQQDYSIIQLDRPTRKRTPLKLNLDKKIADNAKVFMIGHPYGLPLMLSREAPISNNGSSFQFTTSLDSFDGNSGSPVINARTLQVEGILVNGQEDLVQDSKIGCYRNKVYDGAGGEGVFRISELRPFLN